MNGYEKTGVLSLNDIRVPSENQLRKGVAIIECVQEIPCNPCTTVCPTGSIVIKEKDIMGIPSYEGECIGCNKCVLICPGLAITLVDYRKDEKNTLVTVPYEISNIKVNVGDLVDAVDMDGNFVDKLEIVHINDKQNPKTHLVKLKAKPEIAAKVVSFRVQDKKISEATHNSILPDLTQDDAMVCLCERVTVGEIKEVIQKGITDLNQIKAITRAGMGPCGAKTCDTLIRQLLRQQGIDNKDIVENTRRPVFVEVALEKFAGESEDQS